MNNLGPASWKKTRDEDVVNARAYGARSERLSLSIDRRTLEELERVSASSAMSKGELVRRALSRLVVEEQARAAGRGIRFAEPVSSASRGTSAARRVRTEHAPLVPDWVDDPGREAEPLITSADRAALSNLALLTTSIVIPEKRVVEGSWIRVNDLVWDTIVDVLRDDWSQAYVIPHGKFEELIAGAFERAGYDQVILTPRSGDKGRDVIALKRGVGCVKIIGSVKRYAAHRPVRYDDVRALMGTLSSEADSSKGMVITTSSFPQDLANKDEFRKFIPTRIELLDGQRTLDWLMQLRKQRA